jgi:polyhydroxybutyrate depolymerase
MLSRAAGRLGPRATLAPVRIVLAAVAVVAVIALVPATDRAATTKSSSCAAGKRTGRFVATVQIEGVRRTALVDMPAGARVPLVLALHGAGGNGRFMERYSGLTAAAHPRGVAVAYPDAEGKFWQLAPSGEQAHDDIAFIRALVDQLEATTCVDPQRVYATGVSNGGGLTARLGCELSDRIAAIAPVAGTYAKLPACHPDRPVSVLEIHGTADAAVPYSQVAPFLAQWSALDGCRPRAARRRLALRTLLAVRSGCRDGTSVQHVELMGAPHAWPGTPIARLPGHGSRFSAAGYVLRFFAGRKLAPSATTPAASASQSPQRR